MLKVIRSSAGAGKTHALVKHYLAFCLSDARPDAYRQALALTFTNAAADEMRERALSYLKAFARGSRGDGAVDDARAFAARQAGTDEGEVARRAQAALRHMLHHWSEVAVSTIDAFTRRVARPFARDLQLDQALRMTTDADWYRERAVDALIAEAGSNGEVTALLAEACRQLLHEEARWDPAEPLAQLALELEKESAIGPLQALHAVSARDLLALIRRLREETEAARRAVRAIGEEALALLAREGIGMSDLYQGKSGPYGWFSKLAAFGKEWIGESNYTAKAIASGKWHSGSAGPEAIARINRIAPELERLHSAGLDALGRLQRGYHLKRAALRELPAAFALRELSRCLEHEKQADGVAFFSDITRRVAAVLAQEHAPWIMERAGSRYRHILVDEFQDTSLLQWACLLPLIDEALANQGSAVLVGDAKQAIYRWRNGEARLLTRLPGLFGPQGPDDARREGAFRRAYQASEPLTVNRRSGHAIVDLNNRLFAELKQALPESLREVYDAHEQRAVRSEEGFALLHAMPEGLKGEELRAATDAFLLRSVEQALADGFAPGDIAVLVRGRTDGRRAAEALAGRGLAVASPDGAQLASSPAARLVIDLLRVIDAGDPEAAVRAWQRIAPGGHADGVPGDPFAALQGDAPLARVQQWLRANGSPGLRTSVASLIAQLLHALGLDPARDAQLMALLDEAHAFGTEHGQLVGGFIHHWERKGGARSTAAASDGTIQVMTIHKSKGLQFPVVVMPRAAMAGQGIHRSRIWLGQMPGIDGLPAMPLLAGGMAGELGIAAIEEERQLAVLDQLNLLYVAFTRPEQRLYAALPPRAKDPVSAGLRAFIAREGNGGELRAGVARMPWKRKDTPAPSPLVPPPLPRRALPLRIEAPAEWDPRDPDPLRRFGNLVHEALRRTGSADSLSEALLAMQREGLVSAEEAQGLADSIGPVLRSPALRPWFAAHLRVRNEASLITADGHALRPDRVVFDGDAVRVLDYKTGAPGEHHHQQVRGYLAALRAMGHTHAEGALLYTRDGTLETVSPP